MSKVPAGLEDLISVDASVIKAIQNKNRDKVSAVVTQKSARIADALKAQAERDNAAALEFEALAANSDQIERVKQYAAHNLAAVAPINALDAIETDMSAEIDAIRARYGERHRDAAAAVEVAMHNVREARALVDELDAYPGVLASEKVTLPQVAARLNKRGRGRGGGGGARTTEFAEGDTVYLQHTDKETGDRYIWGTVATPTGVMVRGVDTALSTSSASLRVEVDPGLDDGEKPYHPGNAWRTYPPAGKAFEGVEVVDISA